MIRYGAKPGDKLRPPVVVSPPFWRVRGPDDAPLQQLVEVSHRECLALNSFAELSASQHWGDSRDGQVVTGANGMEASV